VQFTLFKCQFHFKCVAQQVNHTITSIPDKMMHD